MPSPVHTPSANCPLGCLLVIKLLLFILTWVCLHPRVFLRVFLSLFTSFSCSLESQAHSKPSAVSLYQTCQLLFQSAGLLPKKCALLPGAKQSLSFPVLQTKEFSLLPVLSKPAVQTALLAMFSSSLSYCFLSSPEQALYFPLEGSLTRRLGSLVPAIIHLT